MANASPDNEPVTIVWFRNDLRLADNPALHAAADRDGAIVAVFILDEESEAIRPLGGAQRWWLHHSLDRLAGAIADIGGRLILRRGKAGDCVTALVEETGADAVYWNRRYDPAGIAVDSAIKKELTEANVEAKSFAGHLLHEPARVQTTTGGPYRVYTPFWRAIESKGDPHPPVDTPESLTAAKARLTSQKLSDWALLPTKPDWSGGIADTWTPGEDGARARLDAFVGDHIEGYEDNRDKPFMAEGTSGLSPHLAFGEISPYQVWEASRRASKSAAAKDCTTFRKELVWREFCYHLLYHYPTLPRENYNDRFDAFPWVSNAAHLAAWQKGLTGYPIVDAGMRQLWQTGWMHNRVRMIVASFLTKDLMIHWRAGEEWFWDTLVDGDPASNAANWQWVAGCGADAAPYFRIFNPVLQGRKFDPDGHYVRAYVPELSNLPANHIHEPWSAPEAALSEAGITLGDTYPAPIVDHKTARKTALSAYDRIKDAA